MSGFDARWLDLREPADGRARNVALIDALRATFSQWRVAGGERDLAVTDLGGGTGANFRWLAPRLGGTQAWQIVDHDPALLAALPSRIRIWAHENNCAITDSTENARADNALTIRGNSLSAQIDCLRLDLNSTSGRPAFSARSLVTASALLDLVSSRWLTGTVERLVAAGAAACFALTYDGRIALSPSLPSDARLRDLVNRHQLRDKGFGAALGPSASAAAAAAFARSGYRLVRATSDWQLGASDSALQTALIEGWRAAALEVDPTAESWLMQWANVRNSQIAGGALEIVVGHEDLVAMPPS